MKEVDYAPMVAKGVALLDEKRPGWRALINKDILDIGDPSSCVSAQLSGRRDYHLGMTQLGLTLGNDGTYTAHGFDAIRWYDDHDLGDDYQDAQQTAAYALLTRLWLAEVSRDPDRPQAPESVA